VLVGDEFGIAPRLERIRVKFLILGFCTFCRDVLLPYDGMILFGYVNFMYRVLGVGYGR
jgi:hypothetical protein